MKKDFVNRCWGKYDPKEIADFLGYTETSVYRLYDGTFDRKWQNILESFREKDIVKIEPETKQYELMRTLREKGYTIVNVDKYQYKMI